MMLLLFKLTVHLLSDTVGLLLLSLLLRLFILLLVVFPFVMLCVLSMLVYNMPFFDSVCCVTVGVATCGVILFVRIAVVCYVLHIVTVCGDGGC